MPTRNVDLAHSGWRSTDNSALWFVTDEVGSAMKSEERRLQPWTALVFAICVSTLIIGVAAGKIPGVLVWFPMGFLIGTAFHELGHLTCATIGSIPVYRIVIGAGPLLWRSRFGETWLELRALPLAGRVEPSLVVINHRCRWALILLGGVLGNLVVICILYGLHAVGAAGKADDFLGPVMFAQMSMIIGNLVPFSGRFGTSDGMRLLRLLWRRASDQALPAQFSDVYNAFLRTYGGAKTQFTMTEASSRLVYHLFRFQTNKEAYPEAREGVLRELHRGDLSREEQMWVLDALITDGIVSRDPAARLHLDAWSRQALALGPDLTTLQGSRGAVLVELGRYDEGKTLLAPLAGPDQPVSFDAFMSRTFLALAERGLGNEAAARQLADAARATAKAAGASPRAMLARLDSEIPDVS
jgi:hypothetical protein